MATIVTRAGKGSALSHNEVDANFTNLNSDKLEANSNITVADATVTGDLTVQGTTTTLNTATLQVEDKNITLNYSTGDSSGSADGAGITIQDAVSSSTDATILWDATNDTFDFSHALQVQGLVDIASGEIGLKNSGSVSNIKFYCEVSNAHYTALQSSPHSAYSGNVTLTLPPATDTLVGRATTDTLTNKTLTSPVLSGNVGINTASPADELHINATSANVNMRLTRDTDTGARISGSDGASTPVIKFDTIASGTATERARIDASGRLGVNVTDPDEKLEVGGDVKIGQSGDSGVLHFGNTSDQTKIIGRGSSHATLADTMDFYTDESHRMRLASSGLEVSQSSGDAITLKDTNLTASASDIGNVRVAWDDSAGTRVAYVGSVNSDEFWVNNQYSKVVLTYAGSRMFETVSGGAKLYGKLNITDSAYDNHLELNRSSEQWRISPSTDGSLDIRRVGGTGTARTDIEKGADYTTADHFLLPNANNSESPNSSTARNGGAINYIYNRSSNLTLTRGDFAHHIIQQWSHGPTFTLTSSTFQRGDIVEFINVKGAVTITVVGTIIYLPNGSNDTTLTLSQAGKFRLVRYSSNAGYWMVG